MDTKKNKRGITLIALIITIIVMLILVSVSISMVLNTGIFETAGKAMQGWKTQQDEEQKLASGKLAIGDKEYNGIYDYIKSICSHEYGEWTIVKEASYTEAGEKYRTCTKCGLKETIYPTKLECTEHEWGEWEITKEATCQEIGAKEATCEKCGTKKEEEIAKTGHGYVDGKCPVCGTESSIVIGAPIDYKEYIDPNTGAAFTTMPNYESTEAKNGYTSTTYTVANESGIEWIVLGEENGQIKITTKNIVQPSSGGYTSGSFNYLRFYGQVGYTNLVNELHEIGAIYGKGKHADTGKFTVTTGGATGGRSFEMEDLGYGDLTRTASYTYAMHEDGKVYRYDVGAEVDGTSTTGGSYSTFKYMKMDASEATEETEELRGWGELSETNPSVTMYQYTYSGSRTLDTSVSKADTYYWLASRCLYHDTGYVYFAGRYISSEGYSRYSSLYGSYDNALDYAYGVRPVVYLKSDIQLSYNSETGYTISP